MEARKQQNSNVDLKNQGNLQRDVGRTRTDSSNPSSGRLRTGNKLSTAVSKTGFPAPSLAEKLEDVTSMPSIHEMATGTYCPAPLYYKKVI